MWFYNSPIGKMSILRLPDGRYGLQYNGTVWESCSTPQSEADNVYMHCTGCYEWDCLDGKLSDVPHDLSEWEHI